MSVDKPTIRRQIESLEKLPPFPEIAQKILTLRAQPEPNASDLSAVIDLDPSLSAQVIRYARSSLYGYRGNIDSVENAISRVLGYEMVLNLALGIATARPLAIPTKGPLGAQAYWNNAIRSAVLTQRIAQLISNRETVIPSMAYLAGLLQDFGLLVISHLFPESYQALNKALDDNPHLDLVKFEYETLGITQGEAGARALRFWDLPDELVVTALKHRDPFYQGLHASYAHLVYIANALLYAPPSQYANTVALLAQQHLWFTELGLPTDSLLTLAEETIQAGEDIADMVRKLAA